ncbi:hypothetical protein D3C72_2253140 [compost metagenome]
MVVDVSLDEVVTGRRKLTVLAQMLADHRRFAFEQTLHQHVFRHVGDHQRQARVAQAQQDSKAGQCSEQALPDRLAHGNAAVSKARR